MSLFPNYDIGASRRRSPSQVQDGVLSCASQPQPWAVREDATSCYTVARFRGGGGDGGSTGAESRSSYLEMYKEHKVDKVDPAQLRHARWTRCSFSGKALAAPIVADEAGSLFNKEDLFAGLAEKASGGPWPAELAHIRLKELLPVHPELNSNYLKEDRADSAGVRPGADAPFVCPLTSDTLSGRGKTFLHRPTGLLLSEKGLKQVPQVAHELLSARAKELLETADHTCASAEVALKALVENGGKWEQRHMMVANPEGEDAEDAQDRLKFIMQKRNKKRKKGKEDPREAGTSKRPAGPAPLVTVGGGKRSKGVLESLFHEDGGGAMVKETYCCRSIGARGMNLS